MFLGHGPIHCFCRNVILIKLVGWKGQTHDELPLSRSGDWKDSIWCEGGAAWVLILTHRQFLKVNMLINKRKDISVEVTYLYISGIVTIPKQSECNVNSYNKDTVAFCKCENAMS